MSTSFNDQFDQHGKWRREFALRLKLLSEWLKGQDLLNPAVEERLKRLESQMRSDKVMVAFVAEFSRGKSELINALFFANFGRRIMPASAGRTTMCPTELSYDAEIPPCLRLLPIETRLAPQALMEWRAAPQKWLRIDLDINNPAQLAHALEKVSEVKKVTTDEARALGFWHEETPEDNPPLDDAGMVEVPQWRHALINIAHPLLKQGLVILDTPGLNAIGAEPELTVSLIPQAHAAVFILAADTGVTKSDLSIWREHLVTETTTTDSRLVVLNKIDTLWDDLSTPAQVQGQISRQCISSAQLLGLPVERVIPVSAQKALVARINKDTELFDASNLAALETALGDGMLGSRQNILRSAVAKGVSDLRVEAGRVITIRRRDVAEQVLELKGLRGKNSTVIKHMRSRIEQEQVEFDLGGSKIPAVRAVHKKLLNEVIGLLSTSTLKIELQELNRALLQPGIKLGVKRAYGHSFDRLREGMKRSQALVNEIQAMLNGIFRQLNAEYGFTLQVPKEPDIARFIDDLSLVERSHQQYLGVTNAFRLAQPEFAERLVRALGTRLRNVYESASSEVEMWSKSAAAQLDAQLRERKRNFGRRMEAIDRIQQAASGLDERLAELATNDSQLVELDGELQDLTSHLIDAPTTPDVTIKSPARRITRVDVQIA